MNHNNYIKSETEQEATMKNAYELLLNCPDSQIKRMQLVYRAVADGDWNNAVFWIKAAVAEEGCTEWAEEAAQFGCACAKHVNPYQLVAENSKTARLWGLLKK